MEFQYKDNCTFCHSRIGSKRCLLPYEFVCNYQHNGDALSVIVDVTELHMTYGIEALQYNFEFLYRVRSRPTSDAIQSRAQSYSMSATPNETVNDSVTPLSPASNNFVVDTIRTTESELKQQGNRTPTGAPNLPGLTESSDSINVKSLTDKLNDTTLKTNRSYASAVTKESNLEHRSKVKDDSNMLKQYESRNSTDSEESAELTQSDESHLTNDLIMAILVAHAMTNKHQSETRVSKLFECIDTEIGMKERLKQHYVSKRNTNLDHPIALARELIASHSDAEILSWQEGRLIECTRCCILNYPPFSTTSQTVDNDRLVQTLISYCSSILKSKMYKEKERIRLSQKIAITLELRGNIFAHNWLKTKLRSISNIYATKRKDETSIQQEHKSSLTNHTEDQLRILTPRMNKHSCPPVEQTTLEFLQTHLSTAILKVTKGKELNYSSIPKELTSEDFFFTLITEFVKHNKSWHNPNSLASTKSLLKASEHSGFNIKTTELTNILWLASEIVSILRNESKRERTNP